VFDLRGGPGMIEGAEGIDLCRPHDHDDTYRDAVRDG
jgi:hypothetical protein